MSRIGQESRKIGERMKRENGKNRRRKRGEGAGGGKQIQERKGGAGKNTGRKKVNMRQV